MNAKETKNIKSETMFREATVDPAQIKAEERTLTVSCASEAPVERWFGNEVLSHAPGALDLSRVNGKGAVLRDHDTSQHVGVIDKAWISDGRTYANIRFSKSAAGQQEMQDMLDGIRTLMSVGYRIQKMELLSEVDGVKTYRATKWQLLELSTVAVPADATVGFGRSEEIEITKNKIMAETTTTTTAAATVVTSPSPDATFARNVNGILELATAYKVPMADAQRFIKDGKTADEFQGFILETRFKGTPAVQTNPAIGMSEKEVGSYSIVRAISAMANAMANGVRFEGIEKEASDAVAKRLRRSPQGFFVPSDVSTRSLGASTGICGDVASEVLPHIMAMGGRRALNATTLTAGGYTVATDVLGSSMIELLRNNMVINTLGATNLSGLVGDVAIPKQTGGATAYWLPETTDVTVSTQTFGQLLLTPHRLAAATAYTKQLLAQSSIDVEGFVRNDLMTVLALAKDLAAIGGTGAAGEPLGILNTSGVGSITYGAATTWAKIVENETTLYGANVNGTPAFVSSFATQGKWKTAPKVSAQAIFLIEGGMANGYKFAATTQMPSGDKSIFGVFSDLIIADWDGIDITIDPYSLSLGNQVRIVVNLMTDVGVRNPVSFVVSTDSAAQ